MSRLAQIKEDVARGKINPEDIEWLVEVTEKLLKDFNELYTAPYEYEDSYGQIHIIRRCAAVL